MRLWSLHPSSLDRAALIASWREAKLARAVLAGQTKGYRNHPQLDRFRVHPTPLEAIDAFLHELANEADRRGYCFDRTGLGPQIQVETIPVQAGQVRFELAHLREKIRTRARREPNAEARITNRIAPIFRLVPGGLEPWERP